VEIEEQAMTSDCQTRGGGFVMAADPAVLNQLAAAHGIQILPPPP
jgi:hypothetical protein